MICYEFFCGSAGNRNKLRRTPEPAKKSYKIQIWLNRNVDSSFDRFSLLYPGSNLTQLLSPFGQPVGNRFFSTGGSRIIGKSNIGQVKCSGKTPYTGMGSLPRIGDRRDVPERRGEFIERRNSKK